MDDAFPGFDLILILSKREARGAGVVGVDAGPSIRNEQQGKISGVVVEVKARGHEVVMKSPCMNFSATSGEQAVGEGLHSLLDSGRLWSPLPFPTVPLL